MSCFRARATTSRTRKWPIAPAAAWPTREVGGVFDAAAVTAMIHKVFAGRVQFHDGDEEIAPGIIVAQGRRSHARHADRARGDRAGLGRARLRYRALLRQPRTGPAVSDPRQTCPHTSRRSAPRCGWRARRSISFRVTIRWCWHATRARERDSRASPGSISHPDATTSHDCGPVDDPRAARFHRRRAHGRRRWPSVCWLRDIRSPFTTRMRRPLRRLVLRRRASACESPAAVASAARIVFASLPTPSGRARRRARRERRARRQRQSVSSSTYRPPGRRRGDRDRRMPARTRHPVTGCAGQRRHRRRARRDARDHGVGPACGIRRRSSRCSGMLGRVFYVGEKPGLGQTLKLANNLMSQAAIAITAEALAIGVKAGLDPQLMLDVHQCLERTQYGLGRQVPEARADARLRFRVFDRAGAQGRAACASTRPRRSGSRCRSVERSANCCRGRRRNYGAGFRLHLCRARSSNRARAAKFLPSEEASHERGSLPARPGNSQGRARQ